MERAWRTGEAVGEADRTEASNRRHKPQAGRTPKIFPQHLANSGIKLSEAAENKSVAKTHYLLQ